MFFFFQAEDGIRDLTVTGVQTCALPIYRRRRPAPDCGSGAAPRVARRLGGGARLPDGRAPGGPRGQGPGGLRVGDDDPARAPGRARHGHTPRLARHPHRLSRVLRRNALALGADYGLSMVALSLASPATILPAFAAHLGAPNVVIGAIPAVPAVRVSLQSPL